MERHLYQILYDRLFNSVTDAIRILDREGEQEAKNLLIRAQQEAEQTYIDHGPENRA